MKIPLFFHDKVDASVTSFCVAHYCWFYFYEEVLFMVAHTHMDDDKGEIKCLDLTREEAPILLPSVTGITPELIERAIANIDRDRNYRRENVSYSDLQRYGLEIIGDSISKLVVDKLTS